MSNPLSKTVIISTITATIVAVVVISIYFRYFYTIGPPPNVQIVLGCKEMQALTGQQEKKQSIIMPTEMGAKEVVIRNEPYQYKTVWRSLNKNIIDSTLKTDYPYVRYPNNIKALYYVLQCNNNFQLRECELLMDKMLPSINNGEIMVKVSDIVIKDNSNKFYTLLSYNQGTYKDNYLVWNDKANRFILEPK